jgi:peptidoglycan/LPS O-acetylase OafA/YrhL
MRPAEPGRHRLTALFLTQAVVLGGAGLALLIASDAVLAAWPWAISRLLARVYAAFFLAFAVGALLAAYERRPRAVQALLAGSLALLVFTLTTTLLHLDRFSSGPALGIWFAVHLAGLAAFGYGLAISSRGRESAPPLSAPAP